MRPIFRPNRKIKEAINDYFYDDPREFIALMEEAAYEISSEVMNESNQWHGVAQALDEVWNKMGTLYEESTIDSEDYIELWENYGSSDFIEGIRMVLYGDITEEELTDISEASDTDLLGFYESLIPGGYYYTRRSGRIHFNIGDALENVSTMNLRKFIKSIS